ncbi:MAG: hypothetical protein V2A74_04135 [bacterium]
MATSTNHVLEVSTMDSGGGIASSANYVTETTLGQPADASATSSANNLVSGFYQLAHETFYHFANDAQGWMFFSFPTIFTAPTSSTSGGRIALTSTSNTGTYGYFQCPAFKIAPNTLYRCRFLVTTDVTNPLTVPGFRIRAHTSNFQSAQILGVNSRLDSAESPTATPKTYDLYFYPAQQIANSSENDMFVTFEIVNFDPGDDANATLAIQSVIMDALSVPNLSGERAEKTYIFATNEEGWTFNSITPDYSAPLQFHLTSGGGVIGMTSTTNTNTFGFWQSPVDVATEANRLYRATYTVRTNVADPTRVPQLRVRLLAEGFQMTLEGVTDSAGSALASPITTNRDYDLFMIPPQSRVGTSTDGLIAAFDMINFNASATPDDPTGSFSMDQMAIKSYSVPISP